MEHMKEERRTDGHPRKKKEGRTDHKRKEILGTEGQTKEKELE